MGLGPGATSLLSRLGLLPVSDAGGNPAWVEADQQRRTILRLEAQAKARTKGKTKSGTTKKTKGERITRQRVKKTHEQTSSKV